MESSPQYPKCGVAVLVIKDGKALLGKRISSHGAGHYAFPGGKLEWMESFEDCARRETMEEAGIEIKNVRFLRLMNFKAYDKHFVDVGMVADWDSGEPKVMEPEKCENWAWHDIDNMPTPLFSGCETYIDAYKTKKYYYGG